MQLLLLVGGSQLRHRHGVANGSVANVAVGRDRVVWAASVWLEVVWKLAVGDCGAVSETLHGRLMVVFLFSGDRSRLLVAAKVEVASCCEGVEDGHECVKRQIFLFL